VDEGYVTGDWRNKGFRKKAVTFLKKSNQKTFALRAGALEPHCRHCERSEAIHLFRANGTKDGLLRRCAPRNDGFGPRHRAQKSFTAPPDAQSFLQKSDRLLS
jgi:hypothetical protein